MSKCEIINWKERAEAAERDLKLARNEAYQWRETCKSRLGTGSPLEMFDNFRSLERERDGAIAKYEEEVRAFDDLNKILDSVKRQRDELAAHVERVIDQARAVRSSGENKFHTEVEGLLQDTERGPATSISAHDAKLLRRAARKIGPDCDRKTDADILLDNMADAIERGES